jgi:hypothetical protein
MAQNDNTEQFSLTLTGNGIEIKRAVTQRQFAAIMSVLMGNELPGDGFPTASMGTQPPSAKISLREYLDQVKASRKPDQIVAIGHYINLHEGQPTFSREDIKARFAAAMEPMPSNFPRDFGAAVKARMIAAAHQKAGHYYVTKTGIASVDRRFDAETKKN